MTNNENKINALVDSTWWKPKPGVSFDWNLNNPNKIDSVITEIIDVDAFETSAETVATLHLEGKKVIAYVSVGTIEKSRPDLGLLPSEIVGKVYPEWPDEKWLNIHEIDKMKPWLISRFEMIKRKGFDAIEPDNLDGYGNVTGFDISLDDTKLFCNYIIDLAHSLGLGIGQKNMPELTLIYCSKFDWALTEDAFQQGWQQEMLPYINKNKPVFAVEYTDKTSQNNFVTQVCPVASSMRYSCILKNRMLDKWIYFCH